MNYYTFSPPKNTVHEGLEGFKNPNDDVSIIKAFFIFVSHFSHLMRPFESSLASGSIVTPKLSKFARKQSQDE
ncbi:unnamed protein product [Malus baccata var. baccata]